MAALGYAGASYEPQRGVDAALLAPSERAKGRGYTYAFLVLSEQLSEPLEKELQGLGVQLLGPHGGTQKARVPIDPARLRAIAAVAGVEAIAYARKDQKIERAARDAAGRFAKQLPGLPVVVSAFDKAALEELAAGSRAKATGGGVDTPLLSISAVVPAERLDELAGLDTVLYVELSRPGSGGHDFSMAVMGVDYIRPGGFGTRFGCAGDPRDPRHPGSWSAAPPTTHQDQQVRLPGTPTTPPASGTTSTATARTSSARSPARGRRRPASAASPPASAARARPGSAPPRSGTRTTAAPRRRS